MGLVFGSQMTRGEMAMPITKVINTAPNTPPCFPKTIHSGPMCSPPYNQRNARKNRRRAFATGDRVAFA